MDGRDIDGGLTAELRPVRPGAVILLTSLVLLLALAFFPDYWDWDLHRLRDVIRLDMQWQARMAHNAVASAMERDRVSEERARARAEARVKARITGSMRELFGGFVTDLAVQPDGKVVAVGYQPGLGIARFERDGSLDREFVRRASWELAGDLGGIARRVEVAPDGGIIVHGALTFRDAPHARLRFHTDGSLDTRFLSSGESRNPGPERQPALPAWVADLVADLARPPAPDPRDPRRFLCGNDPALWPPRVTVLALQPDGRALIARTRQGWFGLIRAAEDGRREELRIPPVCSGRIDGMVTVKSLAFQSDGGVVMAGDLPLRPAGALLCRHAVLWRIGPGFALDEAFPVMWSTDVEGAAYGRAIDTTAVLGDGRIVVGGEFTSLRGEKRRNIAVLRADGTVED